MLTLAWSNRRADDGRLIHDDFDCKPRFFHGRVPMFRSSVVRFPCCETTLEDERASLPASCNSLGRLSRSFALPEPGSSIFGKARLRPSRQRPSRLSRSFALPKNGHRTREGEAPSEPEGLRGSAGASPSRNHAKPFRRDQGRASPQSRARFTNSSAFSFRARSFPPSRPAPCSLSFGLIFGLLVVGCLLAAAGVADGPGGRRFLLGLLIQLPGVRFTPEPDPLERIFQRLEWFLGGDAMQRPSSVGRAGMPAPSA